MASGLPRAGIGLPRVTIGLPAEAIGLSRVQIGLPASDIETFAFGNPIAVDGNPGPLRQAKKKPHCWGFEGPTCFDRKVRPQQVAAPAPARVAAAPHARAW